MVSFKIVTLGSILTEPVMRQLLNVSITTIFLLFLAGKLCGQLERIDSLERTLDTAGLQVKASTLTELSWAYRSVNPELGVQRGLEALDQIYKLGDKSLEAECLLYIGVSYFTQNKLENAMDYFLQSMKIKQDLGDREGIAAILNNLGNISREMGNYERAIEYYQQVREIGEELGSKKLISTAYANLAVNYKALDDFEKALDYNLQALRMREEEKDERGMAASLNNIATIYADSAFAGMDMQKALDYLNRSLAIKEKLDDRLGMSKTLVNIGQLNADLGQFEAARPYFTRALGIARELKATNIEMSCYAHLSYYYEKAGNYKDALHYQILYSDLMDSVYIQENKEQIAEMMVRYETEQKVRENALLKQEAEIQTLQISRQQSLRNFFIAMLVLLLLSVGALYSRYVLKQRTARLLEDKNRQLAVLNATKDKFFSIIAHDLKNPFGTLVQVSEQLREQYHKLNDEQKLRIIGLINSSALLTHDLLANLLQWSVLQTGDIKIEPEVSDLSVLVDECADLLKLNAEKKEIVIVSEVPAGTAIYADRNMMATVIRNLLSNAIKYMDKPGEVKVAAEERVDEVMVSVSDQGAGISREDVEKLFRIDVNTHQIGRSREKGTGLGLILCREFVEKNGGRIWVESEPGKGSTFIFTVPKPGRGISR